MFDFLIRIITYNIKLSTILWKHFSGEKQLNFKIHYPTIIIPVCKLWILRGEEEMMRPVIDPSNLENFGQFISSSTVNYS